MATPKNGDWVKALVPGYIENAKFVKAGVKFQLNENIPFSDKWMEVTDAPAEAKPSKDREQALKVKAELDILQHETEDDARRGKFTTRSVPRSEAGDAARQKAAKADAKTKPAIDASKAQPVVLVDAAQVEQAKKK